MNHSLIASTLAACLWLVNVAHAAEINVLASGATKEVYLALTPQFEKASGHKLVTTWSGSADIKKRITAGEIYDVVIMPRPEIDSFVQEGKIETGTEVDLMKSGVGAAVPANAPKPDISSIEALKKTVLAAKSIGYSTGPSGVHMMNLFEKMGIADEIKPKLKQTPSGVRIDSIIATGEAEIGFQQISELIHSPGIDYIGPLPAEIQKITVFSAGIHSKAKQQDAGKDLIRSLSDSAAGPTIKKHGMEPG